MRRILYYDIDMKFRYRLDLEITGVSSFDEARRLLVEEKFDLVGINAGKRYAFEFAEAVRDETDYPVAVFVSFDCSFDCSLGERFIGGIVPIAPTEARVEQVIKKPRVMSVPHRSLKTAKNLYELVKILDVRLTENA